MNQIVSSEDAETATERKYPVAHAYAFLAPYDRARLFWSITIPVCPLCSRRHTHGGGSGQFPFGFPSRSAGTRVPHCNPQSFIDRRWGRARQEAALAAAKSKIGGTVQYEIVIDLPVPPVVYKNRLPKLAGPWDYPARLGKMRASCAVSDPANHDGLVPDGEAESW